MPLAYARGLHIEGMLGIPDHIRAGYNPTRAIPSNICLNKSSNRFFLTAVHLWGYIGAAIKGPNEHQIIAPSLWGEELMIIELRQLEMGVLMRDLAMLYQQPIG